MRRLIVALIVIAVMAATTGAVAAQAQQVSANAQAGSSQQQIVGQPYCGPWQMSWYVSSGGWWYFWWWRWCYNPSLQNPWYVDWASWNWGGYAGPGYGTGFQYTVQTG